jgi:hypothetical protein
MNGIGITRRALLPLLAAIPLGTRAIAQARPEAALLEAAGRGDLTAVERLLRQGVQVDVRDGNGRTPLLLATRANHVAVARALVAAGADVNAKDGIQDSPFLYAGAEGRTEILKMTLTAGADLASTNRYGGTALIPACHHGHPDTVKVLLATAIDVNHVNNLGWTALLEAVMLGDGGPVYLEIVRLLVGARVNVNIADRDGVTPLAHARSSGYREIAALLEQAGGR